MTQLLTSNGFTVLHAVEDEAGLRAALADPDAEAAVVDVRLPPSHSDEGLRAAIEARTARPGFPVMVISQYVEHLYARELLASGDGAVGAHPRQVARGLVGPDLQHEVGDGRRGGSGSTLEPDEREDRRRSDGEHQVAAGEV